MKIDSCISSVMERRVTVVDIDDTVETVLNVLERDDLSNVPVLDAVGKCFGIITLADLRHFYALKGKPANRRAWEVRSHRVIEVDMEQSVRAVATAMVRNRVHHVLVCEQGKIRGNVSSL